MSMILTQDQSHEENYELLLIIILLIKAIAIELTAL